MHCAACARPELPCETLFDAQDNVMQNGSDDRPNFDWVTESCAGVSSGDFTFLRRGTWRGTWLRVVASRRPRPSRRHCVSSAVKLSASKSSTKFSTPFEGAVGTPMAAMRAIMRGLRQVRGV